ncbi:MAG: hypothetical protein Q8S13_04960 [Dehalococcoidia bacterium]|nr:hypothetical protein [Dehalococcoidia bacterium]
MQRDEALALVDQELSHIQKIHGARNRDMSSEDCAALLMSRLAYLAAAAANADQPWFTGELVKLAATSLAMLLGQPLDAAAEAAGFTALSGVDGARPKIAGKVAEVPPTAICVARDVKRAWISDGQVFVSPDAK